jgi:hypothetical protein
MTSTSTPVSCEEYKDFPFNPLPIEDLGKNIYIPSHNLFDIRSLCFFRPLIRHLPEEDQADGKRLKKKDIELIRRFMDGKFTVLF